MSEQQIREIEVSMEELQEVVDLGKSVSKLLKNRDFKKIVIEGYLEKEAIRLVDLKAHPTQQTSEAQKAIDNQIMAIGCFSNYIRTLRMQAAHAEGSLETAEKELDDIREEMEEENTNSLVA